MDSSLVVDITQIWTDCSDTFVFLDQCDQVCIYMLCMSYYGLSKNKKDTYMIENCYKIHGFLLGHPRHVPNFKPKSISQGHQNQQHGAMFHPPTAHSISSNSPTPSLPGLSVSNINS